MRCALTIALLYPTNISIDEKSYAQDQSTTKSLGLRMKIYVQGFHSNLNHLTQPHKCFLNASHMRLHPNQENFNSIYAYIICPEEGKYIHM